MESAALGVPCFATKCLPYDRVMPDDQLFEDGAQLKQMLTKLKFMSSGAYSQLIQRQWKWLNSPCREGDFNLKNFWLEDNLGIYIDMFRLRQKTFNVSLEAFRAGFEQKKKIEAENTIFKNENIHILK